MSPAPTDGEKHDYDVDVRDPVTGVSERFSLVATGMVDAGFKARVAFMGNTPVSPEARVLANRLEVVFWDRGPVKRGEHRHPLMGTNWREQDAKSH